MNDYDWRVWFAWYPVRLQGRSRYVWLRNVFCRKDEFGWAGEWWVYEEINKEQK